MSLIDKINIHKLNNFDKLTCKEDCNNIYELFSIYFDKLDEEKTLRYVNYFLQNGYTKIFEIMRDQLRPRLKELCSSNNNLLYYLHSYFPDLTYEEIRDILFVSSRYAPRIYTEYVHNFDKFQKRELFKILCKGDDAYVIIHVLRTMDIDDDQILNEAYKYFKKSPGCCASIISLARIGIANFVKIKNDHYQELLKTLCKDKDYTLSTILDNDEKYEDRELIRDIIYCFKNNTFKQKEYETLIHLVETFNYFSLKDINDILEIFINNRCEKGVNKLLSRSFPLLKLNLDEEQSSRFNSLIIINNLIK